MFKEVEICNLCIDEIDGTYYFYDGKYYCEDCFLRFRKDIVINKNLLITIGHQNLNEVKTNEN